MSVRVGPAPLSVSRAYTALEDPQCGGVVLFLGRVRPDRSRGKSVKALSYETHRPVTEATLDELRRTVRQRFGARKVVLWHRTGIVPVGAASVIVGVAAPHRSAAFDAARFLIDRLKITAPIWKSDVYGGPPPRRRSPSRRAR